MRWLSNLVNGWVILVSILIAGGMILMIALALFLSPVPAPAAAGPAALKIIPAPTLTLTPTKVLETPTPTRPPTIDGIYVGSYVQISGTEGQGLRLRSGPGTASPPRFLGMDAEVFLVKDGPKESDGYTWWFLEAPYDAARSGWGASSFLTVVNNPTPTP